VVNWLDHTSVSENILDKLVAAEVVVVEVVEVVGEVVEGEVEVVEEAVRLELAAAERK